MYKKKHLTETHRRNIGLAIKGKIRSEETRKRMSEGGRGRVFSDEHRKNISLSKVNISEETRAKISAAAKKRCENPDYISKCSAAAKKRYEDHPELKKQVGDFHRGMRHSEETKAQLSVSIKHLYEDPEYRQKNRELLQGLVDSLRGKPRSEEHCRRISESKTGVKMSDEARKNISNGHKGVPRPDIAARETGSKSHFWKGGISFDPYCPKFNNEFKERVRAFFGYSCLICGHVWQKGEKKLSVHHVNFRKDSCCNNDVLPLFVPLCSDGCHQKTNYNRNFWEDWFTEIINEFYNGKCYFTKEEMISFLKKSL